MVAFGVTDYSVTIIATDDEGVGAALTPGNCALSYQREAKGRPIADPESISLSSLSAEDDAHADGGLFHIGEGRHRLDLPDAAFVAGADQVRILQTSLPSGARLIVPPIYLTTAGYAPPASAPVKATPAQFWTLVQSFPSLAPFATAERIADDFDVGEFDIYAGTLVDAGAIAAASFIRSVYDQPTGNFDVVKDFVVWDRLHQSAFIRWMFNPFVA